MYFFQRIDFAGLTFESNTPHRDWEGLLVEPDGLDGWWDAAGIRRDAAERVGRHGSFPAPGFHTDRLVTVRGHAVATSTQRLQQFGEQLAALPTTGLARFVVDEGRGTRWAEGVLHAAMFRPVSGSEGMPTARFDVQVWMPDPLKYGESHRVEVESGKAVMVDNRGTTDARPVVHVHGPLPSGWWLRAGGRELRVRKEIPLGRTYRVDTRSGRIWYEGKELFGVTTGAAPLIRPGHEYFHFGGGSGGRAVIEFSDTYL